MEHNSDFINLMEANFASKIEAGEMITGRKVYMYGEGRTNQLMNSLKDYKIYEKVLNCSLVEGFL
jgi:hypothetical protein